MIGFVGLGVMGEPMCRNLAAKSGHAVVAFDTDPAPLARLAGVRAAGCLADVAEDATAVFLMLPGGPQLADACRRPDGLLARCRPGQTVVDCGTSPVELTRELAAAFATIGVDYADAPVARTRFAAEAGTLSIMVGAEPAVFARIRPLLACCGSDIAHCGGVGAGQVVKLMNNMVLTETVVALSEALAIARAAGVDGAVLFETLMAGSADSFALRNHGMRAVLPADFPERSFSARYMLKDVGYARSLAEQVGVPTPGAAVAAALLEQAVAAGLGEAYWPALATLLGPSGGDDPG